VAARHLEGGVATGALWGRVQRPACPASYTDRSMNAGLFRRRSATAAWIYVAVTFGIIGMVIAARVLGRADFGVYATALVAVGFFQVLLDLTVEESLTKYGFRYVATEDWGRLRRLFRVMLLLKLVGGAAASAFLFALAPFADSVFGEEGVGNALVACALLPFVQSVENIGSTALLLHSRYDLRGAYQAGSAGLRLVAIAIGAPLGVSQALLAIVIAQAISTTAVSLIGVSALRRFPRVPERELGDDVPGIRSFVLQSSVATGVISLRTTLVPLVLGIVAGPTQVGLFRIAQTPQNGLAAASSPARLMLLTEQTRDWERGRHVSVLAGIRTYTIGAAALMLIAVPVFYFAMPWLVETVFGAEYGGAVDAARVGLIAAAIQFAIGWTKSLPVTVGRPKLRIVTHGLETLVVIPLVAVLGAEWGATGAAVAVLVSTVVFAAAWAVAIARLRMTVGSDPTRLAGESTP
jgi:O-antigen/teichoic acid export membrane protein